LQRLASTLKKKLPLVKNQLAQIEIQPVLNSVLTKQTESILQAINASSTSTEPGFLEQPLQSQIMPQVANTLLSGENSYIHAQKESSGQRVSFFSDTLTNDTASTNAAPNNFVKQYPQVPTSVQHPGLPIENHQSTPPPIDNNAREQQPNEGNARNSTPPLSDTRV
jgi:hypothetical protein